MPVYKAEALVLRHQPLGEVDRIITLFTREGGKVRAVARGIRRPTSRLVGRVEPFTHGRFLLARGRTFDVVAQVEVVESFSGIRRDLLRAAYAAYVAELVDRFLQERDRHEDVFELACATLAVLDTAGPEEGEMQTLWFALRLAGVLGYRPEVDGCVQCDRPAPRSARGETTWAFSPALGGALCPSCRPQAPQAVPSDPGVLALCAFLLRAPAEAVRRLRVLPTQRSGVSAVVQAHLEHRLESRLRAPAVISRLRQA